jgi:NitT/TauT family transport system substrate-binding protein
MALVVAAASGCASSPSSSSDISGSSNTVNTISVAFGLPLGNSSNPFAWIGSYLGYFKQQHVNPDVIGDEQNGDSLMATGRLDVYINGTTTILDSAAAGKPLAEHAVYNVQSKSQYEGVVIPGSKITKLSQLQGKTIGISEIEGSLETYVDAVLVSGGVKKPNVKFLATGIGAPMGQALKNGDVAAAFATEGQLGTLLSADYQLRYLPRPPFANQFITGNIVARSNLSAGTYAALKGYLRAYTESIVFSKANPRAAMLINWHMYPQSIPKNVPFNQALNSAISVFTKYLAYIGPLNGEYGYMPAKEMQSYADYLGLKGKVNVSKWYTNSLVAYANDFNKQAIINQAKHYKAPNP